MTEVQSKPTVSDVYMALTYPEEQAIRRKFGADPEPLFESSIRSAGRAMLFAHLMMAGSSENEAFDRVSKMTFPQIEAEFEKEDAEIDPEDPETPQGNDD